MRFAFSPNSSDHNGIDDTAEKAKGNIKQLVVPYSGNTERGPLQFSEYEAWSPSPVLVPFADARITADSSCFFFKQGG